MAWQASAECNGQMVQNTLTAAPHYLMHIHLHAYTLRKVYLVCLGL